MTTQEEIDRVTKPAFVMSANIRKVLEGHNLLVVMAALAECLAHTLAVLPEKDAAIEHKRLCALIASLEKILRGELAKAKSELGSSGGS